MIDRSDTRIVPWPGCFEALEVSGDLGGWPLPLWSHEERSGHLRTSRCAEARHSRRGSRIVTLMDSSTRFRQALLPH